MYNFIDAKDHVFSEIVSREIYVDKTGLLKHLNRLIDAGADGNCISVSRPVGFGKSIAAAMIEAYYSCGTSGGKELFGSFEIAGDDSYRKHLQKYHVLSIDMKDIPDWTGDVLQDKQFREAMHLSNDDWINTHDFHPAQILEYLILENLKAWFPHTVSDECKSISEALSLLREKRKRKFVVIIDNWDFVIQREFFHKELTSFYCWYLRDLFRRFNEHGNLALGYITGVLPFTFTDEKNSESCGSTMIGPDEYAPYFGFTGKETKDLIKQYVRSGNNKGFAADVPDSIYRFEQSAKGSSTKQIRINNPRDVIRRCLPDREIPVWYDRSLLFHVWDPITKHYSRFQDDLHRLFNGKKVRIELKPHELDLEHLRDREDVYSLMVHSGYLGYRNGKLYIPGSRILHLLENACCSELNLADLYVTEEES